MGCNDSKPIKNQKKEPELKMRQEAKENKEGKEYEIKICLLGDVAVGKTSIATRFCKNHFNESYVNGIEGAINNKIYY